MVVNTARSPVGFVGRALRRAILWPRSGKRALMLVADLAMIAACLVAALTLKYDDLTVGLNEPPWLYGVAASVTVSFFAWFGLYRAVTRYIGFRAIASVLAGTTTASWVLWMLDDGSRLSNVSASVIVIFGLNVLVWVSATRLLVRWILSAGNTTRSPVVIYGAGEAGARLAMLLAADGRMQPVAYVDEKTSLQGATVGGVPVVSPSHLPDLIKERGVRTVVLAVPAASRRRRAEIIRQVAELGVHVQTVPDLNDLLSGRFNLAQLRDISVCDLLGRDPVAPDQRLLGDNIRGKSVMVTGAGGSIGSELCRQILAQSPVRLVLFELSEYALYVIERELHALALATWPPVEIVPLLGNSRDRGQVRDVMRIFGVQTVYHAAAYKHVPIVEENVIQGIDNNVFATWHAAEAALESGVESFVLISTDKAVHPTNVMGATKRFAEVVLQALQERQPTTRFCMVRFGNVLASSGSVVPLFQAQIRNGGPVTVTHPEVRRYFMTIPEAASLVLQAGSMAKGGEVFLLDMGQPVKIDELARRMIALSGLSVRDETNPDGDVEIQYTGLRPGEKLFEELLIGHNATGTEHPMIMRAMEHTPGWKEVQQLLEDMRRALDKSDCDRARLLLATAVREYRPANQVHDLLWLRGQLVGERAATESVKPAEANTRHLRAVPPG
jgi:FlaA1/EpsC-like NDP-sugar epimerase